MARIPCSSLKQNDQTGCNSRSLLSSSEGHPKCTREGSSNSILSSLFVQRLNRITQLELLPFFLAFPKNLRNKPTHPHVTFPNTAQTCVMRQLKSATYWLWRGGKFCKSMDLFVRFHMLYTFLLGSAIFIFVSRSGLLTPIEIGWRWGQLQKTSPSKSPSSREREAPCHWTRSILQNCCISDTVFA